MEIINNFVKDALTESWRISMIDTFLIYLLLSSLGIGAIVSGLFTVKAILKTQTNTTKYPRGNSQ